MSLREITELSAIISAHSSHVIAMPGVIPDHALHNYWSLARQQSRLQISQLEKLTQELDEFTRKETQDVGLHIHEKIPVLSKHLVWNEKRQMIGKCIEDCFTSEILTRVWAVVLIAADRKRNRNSYELIARSALVFQLQTRMKALQLMVHKKIDPSLLVQMNLVRRRAELWIDFLIGHLIVDTDLEEFAFDSYRSERFGMEHLFSALNSWDDSPWENLMTDNHYLAAMEAVTNSSNATTTLQLAGAILNCFPDAAFYPTGRFKPVAVSRSGKHSKKKHASDIIPRS